MPDQNESDVESADTDEEDHEVVDLSVGNKGLRRFKEYVGRSAVIRLSVQMQSEYLDLVVEEPWWREFFDLRTQITDKLDNERELERAAEMAQEDAEVDGLLARLRELADDARFAKLPTQKAMLQYALRQIPELESIDLSDLRSEIQEIKAKFDAAR